MSHDILGIHHVTALCGGPRPNLEFYQRTLGLRLVKRTVNFDNPHGWHFYFGDRIGRPGTLITFFPHPLWRKGVAGTREVSRTDFGVPQGTLGEWSNRLRRAGVSPTRAVGFGGRDRLEFNDPDGTRLSLVEGELKVIGAVAAPDSDVPTEQAITGVASVAITVADLDRSAEFLTGAFGFAALERDGGHGWFAAGDHVAGQRIEVVEDTAAAPAVLGAGSVHHVAWRVADAVAQTRVRSVIENQAIGLTPLRDRNYFQSIYFREPGGVIFEVATDGPGFLIDEDETTLGTALRLPAEFEPRRAEIEAALPSLKE